MDDDNKLKRDNIERYVKNGWGKEQNNSYKKDSKLIISETA